MRKIGQFSFRDKSFVFGVIAGYAVFFVAGGSIGEKNRPICFDCIQRYGFPFTSYEIGGYATQSHIIWPGLIANILIASIFSVIVGWVSYVLITKLLQAIERLK